jgi:hypothetical protein
VESREERLIAQNAMLEAMVRIFAISLHAVHEKDHLNGGARMMLSAMGQACLVNNERFREEIG